jgi:regulator of sigma E protease
MSAAGRSRYGNAMTAVSVAIALVFAYIFAKDAVTSGLIFAVILIGLVVAHEFAHFATAKLFGVYVHEFGIGFPPKIWGKRFGETEYTINWLPVGGFVRLMGEEDPTEPRSLACKPRWQRLIILASGGVVNLILPIFLFAIAFTIPHEEAISRAIVTSVIVGAPADQAGVLPGDVIYEIGGRNSANLAAAGRLVRLNLGKEFYLVVKRDGELLTLPVYARWTPPAGQGPTGITIGSQYDFTETVSQPPWESIPNGLRATVDTVILARNEIISRFKGGGEGGPAVRGPVGLAQATGELARAGGAPPLFELAALLSINLGLLNLLPLPMLDGGRIAFLLLEVARRGKRIAPEREALVHLIGLVLFVVLFVVVTFADISRIASGESAFR